MFEYVYCSRPAVGSTHPSIHWFPGLFILRGVKTSGHLTQSDAEVKESEAQPLLPRMSLGRVRLHMRD